MSAKGGHSQRKKGRAACRLLMCAGGSSFERGATDETRSNRKKSKTAPQKLATHTYARMPSGYYRDFCHHIRDKLNELEVEGALQQPSMMLKVLKQNFCVVHKHTLVIHMAQSLGRVNCNGFSLSVYNIVSNYYYRCKETKRKERR